jgi:hypothetical protein
MHVTMNLFWLSSRESRFRTETELLLRGFTPVHGSPRYEGKLEPLTTQRIQCGARQYESKIMDSTTWR